MTPALPPAWVTQFKEVPLQVSSPASVQVVSADRVSHYFEVRWCTGQNITKVVDYRKPGE